MTTSTATKATDSVNITNNHEARAAYAALKAAKEAIKENERIKAESEAILRETLGPARYLVILGQKVLRVSSLRKRTNINAKDLLAAFPEAYQATATTTEYDFLEVL